MKNSRLYILEESYRLFLCHNMEKVTISELEKETKKIRGTIFYHFKDKLDLFNSIVNEVFLPQLDIPIQILDAASRISFAAFVESYKSPEERVIGIIKKKYHMPNPERCYFNFLSQAFKYIPDFQEKYSEIFLKEIQVWKTVIDKNGMNDLSLKDRDPNILAKIIILLKTGFFYAKGHTEIPEMDFNSSLLKEYDYLMNPFIKPIS